MWFRLCEILQKARLTHVDKSQIVIRIGDERDHEPSGTIGENVSCILRCDEALHAVIRPYRMYISRQRAGGGWGMVATLGVITMG